VASLMEFLIILEVKYDEELKRAVDQFQIERHSGMVAQVLPQNVEYLSFGMNDYPWDGGRVVIPVLDDLGISRVPG